MFAVMCPLYAKFTYYAFHSFLIIIITCIKIIALEIYKLLN